jgi:hypothetical protein
MYLHEVKDASTVCSRILVEIGITNGVLSTLESLMGDPESGETWLDTTELLSGENSPLALFKISRAAFYASCWLEKGRQGICFALQE